MWQELSPLHRRRRLRHRVFLSATAAAALVSLAFNSWVGQTPLLVYNASASAPKGFYRVHPVNGLRRGEWVLMTTPESVRALADERRYLPASVPMIKTVAALPGDEICSIGATIRVNGERVATRQSHDRQRRPLPQWQGCRTLRSGEFFPLNADSPYSFDGRYFGAVPMALIRGHLEPF